MNKFKSSVNLGAMLGWQDVRQAYRRSAIGPFWITGGMAVQIGAMGMVFAVIFKTQMQEYLPFLATSIILWGYLAGVINDGCLSFITAEGIIKQLRIPMFVHIIRTVWKQATTLAHNLAILPFVFLIVLHGISWTAFLFVPGLVLLTINLTWIAFLLAMLSARFRDIPQVVTSVMTILYFVSPVMWQPSLIPAGAAHLLLGLNPMYHLLQIVRLPLLGQLPTAENWLLSVAFAVVGWVGVYFALGKYKTQIAYWV
jgi:ABC-type polysaccharide/polyol phosphate export permease